MQESQSGLKLWLSMTAVGLFTFMSTLDGSIVNIALPVMSKEMNIPMNQATWTVSIYLIVISGLLALFGNLGDQLGKIKIFRIGTVVFTLGSVLAGIDLGLPFLLFARFVQAVGASMTMSNSFGITTTLAPQNLRGRAMSFIAAWVSLGSILGPALGGMLLQNLSWPYIFWINVPIGIIAIVAGAFLLPKSSKQGVKPEIDWWGAISLFLFVAILFLGFNIAQVQGFLAPVPVVTIIIAIIFFVLFVRHELHAEKPLLDLTIFKSKLFTISLITAFLVFVTNFFINVLMPFYLENLRGLSTGTSGMYMLLWPVAMLVFSAVSGTLADKMDREYVTLFSLTVLAVVMFSWFFAGANTPMLVVGLLLAGSGFGMAFFQSPNNALIMSNAPQDKLGVAGSLNALARNLGMITGTTLVTSVLYAVMSAQLGTSVTTYPAKHPEAFVAGMHVAFAVAGILLVIAFIMTYYRVWMRRREKRA
ncbi:DHA2 family efflux MFS transporter permease subunit [Weissella cibaria]|uniref:MFS transporter n=1 Tax=Weissella cibaria TaxID=137591 RepID=UPI00223BF498|nr:MFS transporter [Weissella cibaria]MCT0958245.1 DHA2 family efflux MFS transporter permease subunit [Weissella cibaria]